MKVLFKISLFLLPIILGCNKTVTINGQKLKYLSTKNALDGYCYMPVDRKKCSTFGKGIGDVRELIADLSLKLVEEPIPFWDKKHVGYKLFLINRSEKAVEFPTQDLRLWIYQEAQDQKGNWKPIENLPASSCGNSYFTWSVCARDSVVFPVPQYKGSFKTMLRFKLLIDNDRYILSNVYPGSISKNQFAAYHLTKPSWPYGRE